MYQMTTVTDVTLACIACDTQKRLYLPTIDLEKTIYPLTFRILMILQCDYQVCRAT